MSNSIFFTAVASIFILFSTIAALAVPQNDGSRAISKLERALEMKDFSGELICQYAQTIPGESCGIRFSDAKTGLIYELSDIMTAQELLNRGQKLVRIKGLLTGNLLIQVKELKAQTN